MGYDERWIAYTDIQIMPLLIGQLGICVIYDNSRPEAAIIIVPYAIRNVATGHKLIHAIVLRAKGPFGSKWKIEYLVISTRNKLDNTLIGFKKFGISCGFKFLIQEIFFARSHHYQTREDGYIDY